MRARVMCGVCACARACLTLRLKEGASVLGTALELRIYLGDASGVIRQAEGCHQLAQADLANPSVLAIILI